MKPLTNDEFDNAISKGMGRVVQHIQEFGAEGIEQNILNACLRSLTYDAQLEDDRGQWLFEIV